MFRSFLKFIFSIMAFVCIIVLSCHIIHRPIGDITKALENFNSIPKKYSEKEIQLYLDYSRMIYIVLASMALLEFQFTTFQSFRAFFKNPTKETSRKFGYELFYNLFVSPIMIITLMTISVSSKEISFTEHIISIAWIPLIFFLNLILWTVTHIAMHCATRPKVLIKTENMFVPLARLHFQHPL